MEMTTFPFTLILYIYSVEAPFTHTRPNGNDDISLHSLLYIYSVEAHMMTTVLRGLAEHAVA